MSLSDSIRQYGLGKAAKRFFKRILRGMGLEFESYFVLFRDLAEEISLVPLAQGLRAAELKIEDFRRSDFFSLYSSAKRDLYSLRFTDPAWNAFGVYRGDDLVYMTWIARDAIRIERIGWERRLKAEEGVLVDSFTLPSARRLGIHVAMNGFRLLRLRESGAERAYVVFLAENQPAARTQHRHGFSHGWKISYHRIGRWSRCREKPARIG